MTKPLIYFDNAATSFPKPNSVYRAHDEYLRSAGNPGRGAHELALNSARTLFEARMNIAQFLGCENPERVIFTPGCTYSINMVLRGVQFKRGDCVVAGALEHNAVMRTLRELQKTLELNIVIVPYANVGIVDPLALAKILDQSNARMCVFSEASNVTGERIPIEAVSKVCADRQIPLLIDAAQTAGTEANCLRYPGVTYWAAPGHKGLLGAPGAGLLVVQGEQDLTPLICGGTGSSSEAQEMPEAFPDRFEPGTLAGPAIAALGAGVEFIQKTGAGTILDHECSRAHEFREWCQTKSWIKVSGNSFARKRRTSKSESAPVVSFLHERMSPDRVADILNTEYSIAVRPGLHCASQAHETLGTLKQGLVRVSFGFFNTADEVKSLCDALVQLNK